ncbi:MAG: hypothetical protein BAJALOKI3v1_1020017, partial [Promethearchaeota archaeon]
MEKKYIIAIVITFALIGPDIDTKIIPNIFLS